MSKVWRRISLHREKVIEMKLCEGIKCKRVWSYRHFDEKLQRDVLDICFGISENPPHPEDIFTFCILKGQHIRHSLTGLEAAHFLTGMICLLESYARKMRYEAEKRRWSDQYVVAHSN